MTVDQYECTGKVLELSPEAAIISNLGVSSYILIDVDDRERNFYMNGAMGLTTPIGLGLAQATDDQVVVLEGDGSLLMNMGGLATAGFHNPSNLTIVVWDNSHFETTGGQRTLSGVADFSSIAEDCGLAAWDADSVQSFENAYSSAIEYDGTSLVSCEVTSAVPENHPRLDYAHSFMKHRFRTAINEDR